MTQLDEFVFSTHRASLHKWTLCDFSRDLMVYDGLGSPTISFIEHCDEQINIVPYNDMHITWDQCH